MRKKEIVAFIEERLDALFPNPTIPLEHTTPYTLLIAVLLSAQCTDARVNQVTPPLFALADTPEAMAKLEPAVLEKMIYSCGFFRAKSKAIIALSKQLIERHGGKVPRNMKALEALPGVGHKTASVVMAQAFSQPAFPVDTHIHRCAHRWGLSRGKNVVETERDLKRAFPRSTWIQRHLQIIYFARRYCPAKGHRVESCPICRVLAGDLVLSH